MEKFNSNEYSWKDLLAVIMGRPVGGLRGIEYKTKHQIEALFATGQKARGHQRGKKEYEGTITLLQSELIALNQAAKQKGFDDITDIDFDVVVSYVPRGGLVTVDRVMGCAITEIPNTFKEGDLYQEIALPFIALDVEYNVA